MRKKIYSTLMSLGIIGAISLMGGCASSTNETNDEVKESESVSEETTNTGDEVSLPNGPVLVAPVPGTEGNGNAESETQQGENDNLEIYEPLVDPDGINPDGLNADAPIRIWGVVLNSEEGMITVNNQSGISSPGEILLNIDAENAYVLDATDGFPVVSEDVQQGGFEAYLGPAMTMSLPPQATPYVVIVNIPDGFRAPQYAVAVTGLTQEDGKKVLAANDGRSYVIADDAEIIPYLTRNIVVWEDITEGSRCLVWLNDDGEVQKVVLFE